MSKHELPQYLSDLNTGLVVFCIVMQTIFIIAKLYKITGWRWAKFAYDILQRVIMGRNA